MRARNRLYLDKDNAKLAGVCAGIADYFGKSRTTVRVCWIIASCFWPPVMIGAYLLLAWLLDPKPDSGLILSGGQPMPADPLAPRRRFADVKVRFDRLETRLRSLESVVTSRAFQIDRELRGSPGR